MNAYLITGATSGIGEAVFHHLCKLSSCVLISRNEEKLKILTKNTQLSHDYYVYDFTNLENVQDIFDYCDTQNIEIKGIIHCAGVSPISNIQDASLQQMRSTYEINAFTLLELCKCLFAYKKRSADCSVIAISSIAANRASSRQIIYASSKAAQDSMILSLAQEGIHHDVRVNALSLGACDTAMLASMNTSKDFRNSITRHYPLGVIAPETVAEIIANLLSDTYKNMTGSIIRLDSGFSVVH